jgi:hypothetical protein
MVAELAEATILPFNYTLYALELESYVRKAETHLTRSRAPMQRLNVLREAVIALQSVARDVDGEIEMGCVEGQCGALNRRLYMAERAFLDPNGMFMYPIITMN